MGLLKTAAIIIASRKELGWLAVIKTGPFKLASALFRTINCGQNMANAKRINGLRILYIKVIGTT